MSMLRVPKVVTEIFQWVVSLGLAVAVALLIRAFLFEPVLVSGQSMDNTLADGQRLFEYKLGYILGSPKAGDIVVVKIKEGERNLIGIPDPTEVDYIKRIIGLPGDEIDIKEDGVYVNGKKLEESYAKGKTSPKSFNKFPLKVEPGKVFVMGDNRERSSDSRDFGMVSIDSLRGKAVFRIWPLKDFGKIG